MESEDHEPDQELSTGVKVISGKNARDAIQALGSETRWKIFSLIKDHPTHIEELAKNIGKDKSTISRHVDTLVKAGIVRTVNVEGSRGKRKQVCPSSTRLYLDIS